MVVTPKARRLIGEAVLLLSDPMRDRWNEWSRQFGVADTSTDLPYEIAEIAFQALRAAERDLVWRLRQDDLHEDARSDMRNDLGFIQAIQAAIQAENVGR